MQQGNQTQQRGNISSEVPEDISVMPLTLLQGREYSPAFSPDGSQVAFAWDGGRSGLTGRFDLYAKVIGSERVEQLTHHPATWIVPAWSPDGRNIAFARCRFSFTSRKAPLLLTIVPLTSRISDP